MPSVNQVILAGNVTRNPELRQTTGGAAVCSLGLAINDVYTNRDGLKSESVCFVEVEAWDKQAQACSQYVHKGDPVLVQGRLKLDQWETDQGEKRSKLRVRATRVEFLGKSQTKDDVPTEAAAHPNAPF